MFYIKKERESSNNAITDLIVYYVPRRIMRVITRRATMLADRSRDKAEAQSVLRAF